jgi:2-polyprenyl-3-methyl-5-hydroxy-6-metoxy-1,4-benzoquinol methylase
MEANGEPGADADVGFEELYARAGLDLGAVPWAALAPHAALIAWLDAEAPLAGTAALVIGCGFGDDAEALAALGCAVTAFDVAPTAIERCRQRFPDSTVAYRVADLFALPDDCQHAFGLVVEIRTLQSLPISRRATAAAAIADTVRSGGRLFVRCLARDAREPIGSRPWPVSREELRAFIDAGLTELELREERPASGRGRAFTVVYERS